MRLFAKTRLATGALAAVGAALTRLAAAGIGYAGGLLVLAGFSVGGSWVAARGGIAVPGPVLGMTVYTLLLLTTPWLDRSLPAARLVASLIGALLVPALVGVALFAHETAAGGWRLPLVLVVSTAITGLATAALFRLAGGRS